MFDFLRNQKRSEEEKKQEALNAYLDNELLPAERERVDAKLAADSEWQQELQIMQAIQREMRTMPRRRVPRNFTLDPAVYGSPQRGFLDRLYPVLRAATALTAFLFVIALAINLSQSNLARGVPSLENAAQSVAMQAPETAEEVAGAVEEESAEAEMESIVEATAESFLLEEETLSLEGAAEASADFAEEADLLPTQPPEFSGALEIVGDDEAAAAAPSESAAARDGNIPAVEGESMTAPVESPANAAAAELPLLPEEPPTQPDSSDEQALFSQMEAESTSISSTPPTQTEMFLQGGMTPILITLGLLFVLLTILTLLARSRL